MRSFTALAGATALALTLLAPPAGAQTTGAEGTELTIAAKVTPAKSGTKRSPRGVRLRVHAAWAHPAGVERPVVASAEVWFPRGLRYAGGRYPRCSKRALDLRGPRACPRRSIMGRATGVAWADTVRTKPRVVIVNGGARRVWLYTTLYRPALVREPVPMTIRRSRGRWAYKARIVVPRTLQIVAGVPVALASFTASAGRDRWLSTTSCPRRGRRPFAVRTHFLQGGFAEDTSWIRCRR